MTTLEHILQMKLGVLDGAFDGWADARTVGRGYGYVDKVIELAATGNLLAGVVEGSARYYTNVRLEEERRAAEQAYREECERKREEAFWQDFCAVREAVFAACRNDSFGKIGMV